MSSSIKEKKKGIVILLVNTFFARCIYNFTVLIVPYSLNVLLITNQILVRKSLVYQEASLINIFLSFAKSSLISHWNNKTFFFFFLMKCSLIYAYAAVISYM